MTGRKRLLEILDSYGADSRRWPVEEREAALAELQRQADGEALLREAARLDSVFKEDMPVLSPSLEAALTNIPVRHRQLPRGIELPSWLTDWRPLTTLAAAATVAGLVVGSSGVLTTSTNVEIELAAVLYGTDSIVESNL